MASAHILRDLGCVPATLPRAFPYLLTCILSVHLESQWLLKGPKKVAYCHSAFEEQSEWHLSGPAPLPCLLNIHGVAGVAELYLRSSATQKILEASSGEK